MSEVVQSAVVCEHCGEQATRTFAERVSDGKLGSRLSVACEHCASVLEADDAGPLRPELRAALLAQLGPRAVLIEADDAVPVLERLREAFALELPALMALKRDLPGPVFRGSTPGEAEQIRQLLADLADVVVVPDTERGSLRSVPIAPELLRLRFFFDAGSGTCLWAASDSARSKFGYAVAASALPIPAELAARATQLVADYDTSIDWQDPGGPSPWSASQRRAFDAQSGELLQAMRVALGSEYELVDERPVLSDAEG